MYPPLDSTSNNIGGKGPSSLQDSLVGQRWEGSDVPASIIEAGKLFSSRMRMTRALRQLWEERERFMKYDRGWGATEAFSGIPEDTQNEEGYSVPENISTREASPSDETDNEDVRQRLRAVEDFYVRHFPVICCVS